MWTRLPSRRTSRRTSAATQAPADTPSGQRSDRLGFNSDNADDHAPWGDSFGEKPAKAFRVYCQNVNGINLGTQHGDFGELCHLMEGKAIDVLGVVEHNLDQTKSSVLSRCYDATRQILRRAKLTIAGSDVTTAGFYKPGGTLQVTTGPAVGRVQATVADPMGRWAAQTFRCKGNKKLTIVTAYQVCQASWSLLGKATAAAQQIGALRLRREDNLDPRVHFKKDFEEYLKGLVVDGHSVIVQGDFNESLDTPASLLIGLANRVGLRDLHAEQHSATALPSTYVRGTTRIDYTLVTPDLLHTVLASGYESPFRYFHSDHRPTWVDFDQDKLFGATLTELPPVEFRDVNTRNKAQLELYLRRKDDLFQKRNVYGRIKRLEAGAAPFHDEAERIDRDLVQLSLSAARKLKRYPNTDWSFELFQAKTRLAILKLHLSSVRLRKNLNGKIAFLQTSMEQRVLLPEGIDSSRKAVAAARAKVREIEANAESIRKEELEAKLLERHAPGLVGDDAKAAALTRIRKAEAKRRTYAKLNSLRNPSGRQGVDRLEIPADPSQDPKQCKEWVLVETPEEIVSHLRRRNQKHFGQAQGTPFTVPPLSEHIDFAASTKETEMVLDGTYTPGALDDCTKLLIKHLKRLPDVKPVEARITDSALVAKLRLWRESTTTSPSGMHLGHWKALVADFPKPKQAQPTPDQAGKTPGPKTPKAPQVPLPGAPGQTPARPAVEPIQKIQRRLRKAHLAMLNYSLRWGYAFDRWKGVVNVMILKEPNNMKIHRLRVLHLYEADYNLLLAVKWRQLIHTAEDSSALHPGQYGSRPRRQAPDPVFIEEMMNEVARSTRTSLIKFDNDATSCYDRIIPAVAVLASRKYGMPEAVAAVMANTLRGARYRLKTEAGVSQEHYSHSDTTPIYGTGQGSGNSPTIWCAISSTLFDCQDEATRGAVFWSPNRALRVKFSMVGFVDDSTGQVNDFAADPQPAPAELQATARREAQHWNDMLHASGGALELKKCSFHHLHWEHEADGQPALKPGLFGPALRLEDRHARTQHTIPMMAVDTAHKTLGHYKDPAGTQVRQQEWLEKQCTEAAAFVTKHALTPTEGSIYYHTVLMPSLRYPLSNTFFTRKALEKIETRSHQSLATALGFNRHTSKRVLYAPTALGGGGMRHLAVEQGIGQLESFVRHWRSGDTQIGVLVRIALHWAQKVAGVGVGILKNPSKKLPHLDVKWFTSLREFLTDAHTQLVVDDDGVLPRQREHDDYIMDILADSQKFTPAEMRRLNYCRLYLRATLLSDIATADGTSVDPAFEQGDSTLESSWDTHSKVHQARPDNKTWALWRRANRRWSTRAGKLHQPLGRWLVRRSDRHRQWPMYYSASAASVYQVCADRKQYRQSAALRHGKYCWIDDNTGEQTLFCSLPEDSTPIGLTEAVTQHMFAPPVLPSWHHPVVPVAATWDMLVRRHPRWRQLRLDKVTGFSPLNWAAKCRHQEKVGLMASIGWTQGPAGEHKFGWQCHGVDGVSVGHCAGTLRHNEANPTRVQLHALVSAVAFIELLATYGKVRRMPVTIGSTDVHLANIACVMCANASLADTAMPSRYHPLTDNWDLLQCLRATLRGARCKYTFSYNPSKHRQDSPHAPPRHQESGAPEEASFFEQQALTAHEVATRAPRGSRIVPIDGVPTPGEGVRVYVDGFHTTRRHRAAIRKQYASQRLADTVRHRYNWTTQQYDQVHWVAHEKVINRHKMRRTHVVKLVHDILPTNKIRHRDDPTIAATCPLCGGGVEDRDHILRCPHPERAAWREQFLVGLEKRFTELETDAEVAEGLLNGLYHWFQCDEWTQEELDAVTEAERAQHGLGWRQIFNGRMAKAWAEAQDDFYRGEGRWSTSRNGRVWTVSVLSHVWEGWFELWDNRNALVHGNDKASRALAQRAAIERRIAALYERRGEMLPCDRDLLYGTVEEHLEGTTTARLVNWYNTHWPVFRASFEESKRRAITGVRSIATYFSAA